MTDFKNIALSEIHPDPNQPRKFYDETAMKELAESIKEKGVLQPILVRPNGKGYLLVCGERRYRAALAVGSDNILKNTIPAVIRELTDDEALELQIIENLQRKDVHPMEEAVAFKSLLEKGKPVEEVATRVGKSVFYVRQRVKLNALSNDWQKVFYAGRMSNAEAMKIGLFDAKVQAALYTEFGRSTNVSIGEWNLRKYRGDLTNAVFDITDPSINKKMGACIGCQHNSATANLFPDSHKSAKCSNIACFKDKGDISFNNSFQAAMADPTMLFVHDEYGDNVADKFVAKAVKEGHKVWNRYSYSVIQKPEITSYDEWREDTDEDEYAGYSEEKLRAAYKKGEVDVYNKQMKEYDAKIAGGKYKKAFMLTGSDRGHFVYLTITKSSSASGSSKATKAKEEAGKLTAADIDEEIKRIQDRQKRLAELDMEKIHAATLGQLETNKHLKTSGLTNTIERGIMVFLLLEKAGGYRVSEFVSKHLKALPSEPHGSYKWHPEYFKKLATISDQDLSLLIRYLAVQEWGNKNTVSRIQVEDTAPRLIAEYCDVNITSIEKYQSEIAVKRKEKADKRIAALREQKKSLVKPAVKKVAKKVAAGVKEFVKARAEKKTK
jgi:ParB family chromosome partitioning protein